MHILLHSVPTLQQATTDPHLHWRLLDTHRPFWVSLLWGHCSFLLGPGVYEVLFVPSKSLFSQSCVSSGGFVVGFVTTSSMRAYAIPRSIAPEPLPLWQATVNPCLCWRFLDTHRQLWLSLLWDDSSFFLGPGAYKVLSVPSKNLFL